VAVTRSRSPARSSRKESDSINASLDDGILRVTVPKPEQARPRRVKIHTASGNGAPAEPVATT
jgi:Hsp20/alpha crystallin family